MSTVDPAIVALLRHANGFQQHLHDVAVRPRVSQSREPFVGALAEKCAGTDTARVCSVLETVAQRWGISDIPFKCSTFGTDDSIIASIALGFVRTARRTDNIRAEQPRARRFVTEGACDRDPLVRGILWRQ